MEKKKIKNQRFFIPGELKGNSPVAFLPPCVRSGQHDDLK